MKTISKKLLWIILVFALFSCTKEAKETKKEVPLRTTSSTVGIVAYRETLPGDDIPKAGEPATKETLSINNRKIIKEGEIYFESQTIAETKTQIDNAVKKYEGYIAKESENRYEDRIEQSVVIRVPAQNFDALVSEISNSVKRFDRKSIEVMDVTEEYLDIDVRLKIKKETENRYRELLKRAKTVADIVSIEKQIGELRADIESVEGRLKYLQDRISYSTLTITFYQQTSSPVGFSPKFKLGLKNGWHNFVWFVIGVINIWPFILFAFVGFWGLRRYRRMKRTKKGSTKTSKKAKT